MQIPRGQRRPRLAVIVLAHELGSLSRDSPFFWCEIVRPPMQSESLAACHRSWCCVIHADATPHNLIVGVEPPPANPQRWRGSFCRGSHRLVRPY